MALKDDLKKLTEKAGVSDVGGLFNKAKSMLDTQLGGEPPEIPEGEDPLAFKLNEIARAIDEIKTLETELGRLTNQLHKHIAEIPACIAAGKTDKPNTPEQPAAKPAEAPKTEAPEAPKPEAPKAEAPEAPKPEAPEEDSDKPEK